MGNGIAILKTTSKISSLVTTFSTIFPYKNDAPSVFTTLAAGSSLVSLVLKLIEEYCHGHDPHDNRGRYKAINNLVNRFALFGFSLMRSVESFIEQEMCIGEDDECAKGIRSGLLVIWLLSVTIDLVQFNEKSEQKTTARPVRPIASLNASDLEEQEVIAQEPHKNEDELKFVPSGGSYSCAIM